ncbi:MAG: MFS transporter [archaeon]|nr:MFS transporter [archaeon]
MALLQMLPEWLWQPFLEASLLASSAPSSSLLLGLDVAEAVRLCFFFVMLSLFGGSYIVLALSRPLLTQHYLPVETRQRAMSLMQPLVITSLILCSSLVPLFAGHDLSAILPTSSLIVLASILIQVIALFSFQSIKRSSQQSQQSQQQQSQSESTQTNSNLPARQNSSSNSSSSSSRTVSNDDASLWRSIANTFAESPSFCSLFAAWSLITLAFGIFSNATLMANPLFYPGMQQPLSLPGLPELSYAQQVAACSVMGQLSSSLWSPLWMSLRRRYGMRRMWMSACVCFCSCLLWPALPLNQGGPLSLCLVSLLSGFSLSPFFLYPVISLMEIDEHSLTRSGVSRMALFMSIVGCTNTLCSMLQGFFSGLVLSAVHFQPSAITESSAQGIAFLFSYIPATLVFISIWCIFGYSVPPLNT